MRISTALTVIALATPLAALADLTGTQTLTAPAALSLDTGATTPSGGDILWSGTAMTPQGSAIAYNLGPLGPTTFASITRSLLAGLSSSYTAAPLPAGLLTVNDVFAVKTNTANYSAVLVTAVSGGSITVQFKTFGAAAPPTGPNITGILNNFSYIPAGFSNSGIAPGALFLIVGTGLADPSAQAVLQSPVGASLSSTLNGAGVKVTVNGTTVVPVFYYAIATALALVLPSRTPLGAGQVTVTYNNQTSPPYPIQVSQSAMGFDSYYGTGSGLGVATNSVTGALYSYSNSIPPGTTVTLWGSGLGADPARDSSYVPTALAINSLAHVYVAGAEAPILYQGAAGYPGLNQVNITIPASTPTGCNVPLVGVASSGIPTNFIALPVGNGPCSDPAFGVSGTQTQSLAGQASVRFGTLFLNHTATQLGGATGSSVSDTAFAGFQSVSGLSYSASQPARVPVSANGCTVTQQIPSATVAPPIVTNGLDAGVISVMNPAGSLASLSAVSGATGTYSSLLPDGFIASSGGVFRFQGAGGADVGPFSAALTFSAPLLNWTNQNAAATITRSSGLLVTWSGGGQGSYVQLFGSATSAGGQSVGSFSCIAPASASQFTVPAYVLAALPAGRGVVQVSNPTSATFTAAGLDAGNVIGSIVYTAVSTLN